MKKIVVIYLLLLSISLNAKILNMTRDEINHKLNHEYKSYSLILHEEYYTKEIDNKLDNKIYGLTETFVKNILNNRSNEKLITKAYRSENQYLMSIEIKDKSFEEYKIFKIKNINKEIKKSISLIKTRKGYYKLELYVAITNKESAEIFNSNIVYFDNNKINKNLSENLSLYL